MDQNKIKEDSSLNYAPFLKRMCDEKEKERELKEEAKSKGLMVEEEPLEAVLKKNLEEFSNSYEKSALIGLQSKIKNHIKEKEDNKRLSLILSSLSRNELGDCELFLELFKEKYLFDSTEGRTGEFYFWNGIHWQVDTKKQRYIDIKKVAEEYEWAALALDREEKLKKELLGRASAIRSSRRCCAVFVFVAVEVPFKGEWDCFPGLLPCMNGIVDLKTGELLKHNPEYYLRHVCQVNYNPKAESPKWDQFLYDITLGNIEQVAFLGRILGSALLGDAKEEKIFYFYGETGRNGKGTLTQTLEKVLGLLARTFPSEMLLMQRNPPSSGNASPDLAGLKGIRFAFFSEINKGRKLDVSKVKNLSGRDTISSRRLYSNVDLQINPSHTMIIQTNYRPEAPADDNALWKRTILVPFNAEFVENPTLPYQKQIDPELKGKLILEAEGILAWLVEGCHSYQVNGLAIPPNINEETDKYRGENDGIANFIEERCEQDPIFECSAGKMRDGIKKFCQANGFNEPNDREKVRYLEKRFEKKKTNKGWFWKGISIRPDAEADK